MSLRCSFARSVEFPLPVLTLLLAVVLVFSLAVSPRPAFAQIELGSSGSIGIGSNPEAYTKLQAYIDGYDYSSNYVYGLSGRAINGENRSYGVKGYANGGGSNFGVYGSATYSAQGGAHYGVYGETQGGDNAGYFSGDVHVTGNLTEASDRKLKRDIRELSTGLTERMKDRVRSFSGSAPRQQGQNLTAQQGQNQRSDIHAKLLQLQPRAYKYRRTKYEGMGLPEGKQFGLVAQQVEKVFPGLVTETVHPGAEKLNDEGEIIGFGEPMTYKSVDYVQLVPIMIQTMREQQAEIDILRAEVAMLKSALRQQGIQME